MIVTVNAGSVVALVDCVTSDEFRGALVVASDEFRGILVEVS